MKIADSHMHIKYMDTEHVYRMLDGSYQLGVSDASLLSIVTHPEYPIAQNLAVLGYKDEYKKINLRAFGAFHERDIYASVPYVEQTERLIALGCDGIKFLHMKPNIRKYVGKGIDDPSYDAALTLMEERGVPVVLHSGDPETFWDIDKIPKSLIARGWFYGDGSYPSCEEHYAEVYRMLDKHPNLKISIAHFFFLSNKPSEALSVMKKYPNVYFDLTPGWEMFLGFSKDISFWRDFFIEYSDRLMFGTDSCTDKDNNAQLYDMVIAALTHSADEFPMPAYHNPIIRGLDLPSDIVEKICYKNYTSFVGETPAPVDRMMLTDAVRKMKNDTRDSVDAESGAWMSTFLGESNE